MAFAWSLVVSLAGVALLVALPGLLQTAQRGYCENGDHPGPCTDVVEMLVPGLVVLAVGTWGVVASVGFLRRRRWGRWAVMVTFSLWAVMVLSALLVEATSGDGPHPVGTIVWLGLLGYFAATVVLAAGSRTDPLTDGDIDS